MSLFGNWPYCGSNKVNLDWLLNEMNRVINEWAQVHTEWEGTRKEFEELKLYVDNYFKNLDVQTEINNKLDEMYASGQLGGFFGNTKYNVNPDTVAIPSPVPYHSTFNQLHELEISGFEKSNYELNRDALALFESGKGTSSVRVYTFNIGAYESGRYPDRPLRDLMHKRIAQSMGAIGGLQEMQTIYNVPADVVYSDDVRKHVFLDPDPDYALNVFGSGYLSFNEITSPTAHRFRSQHESSGSVVFEGQSYLHCNIAVGGKVLSVYNTHLWYKAITNPEDFKIWEGQRDELLAAMNADTNPYKICTGDFNIRQNDHSTLGYDGLKPFTLQGYKLVNGEKYGTLWGSYAVDDIIVSPAVQIVNSGMVDCVDPDGNIDHNLLWADIRLN